jgi:hypothetical protein
MSKNAGIKLLEQYFAFGICIIVFGLSTIFLGITFGFVL